MILVKVVEVIFAFLCIIGLSVGVTYLVLLFICLGMVRKQKSPPNVVRPQFKPVSRHPWCRRFGCQTHVPAGGGYPGMPQSHCYRCGMITGHADKARCPSLPDYCEPIGATFTDKMLMKLFPGKP